MPSMPTTKKKKRARKKTPEASAEGVIEPQVVDDTVLFHNPGLTDMQAKFVELIASGESGSIVDAYTRAGYGEGATNRKGLRNNASQLAQSPPVARAILARREAIERETHASLYASRRWILRRLRGEASDEDSPASARIQALNLLAKASGALDSAVERSTKRSQQSREALLAELNNRLSAAASAQEIDVTPDDDDT